MNYLHILNLPESPRSTSRETPSHNTEPLDNIEWFDPDIYSYIKDKLSNRPLSFFTGKLGLVEFEARDPKTDNRVTEWMWVRFTDIDPAKDCLIARLDNQPFLETHVQYNDRLCLHKDQIAMINDTKLLKRLFKENSSKVTTKEGALQLLKDLIIKLNDNLDAYYST